MSNSCQSSDPGRELSGATVWHTGLLEVQGQFSTEGTIGRSTVSSEQRSCYLCFSIPQNSVLGYSDTLDLIFGNVRRTFSGSS